MKVYDYLENVLMSGEEKETKAKWYYGKIKNQESYGFLFNVVINENNTGGIIPTAKNYVDDDDFVDVINEAIRVFKRSYEVTVRRLKNAGRKSN